MHPIVYVETVNEIVMGKCEERDDARDADSEQ